VEWIPDSNGFRLPTEAEWEYACRAGTTTAYSFGNDASRLGDYAWFRDNARLTTHPVATKRSNAWGLYDMHGNVGEWCWDRSGRYEAAAQSDPTGPATGTDRVVRGGSWFNYSRGCRASYRPVFDPDNRYVLHYFGFRVARTP